jgi:ribosomal protein S12 methylthiotransferase
MTPRPPAGGRHARRAAPAHARADSPPALAFVTLGCPKNTVDSEHMLGMLVQSGFRTVADPAAADVCVVNTCAFLQSAVRESRDTIAQLAELKRTRQLRGLIVTGCLAQRAGDSLLTDFPDVDAVLGTGQWSGVVEAARHVLAGSNERFASTAAPGGALDPDAPRVLSTPRHLAYLKISEGCDHRCTFCVIPQLRGDQKSRSIEDLVAAARDLARHGVREVNLIGQDTTGYGTDLPGKPTLSDLLEALDTIEELAWIRVQYTYPRLWSDRLIETWARAKRVVPYVDMPLQHIAANPLRRMARAMTGTETRELIRRIKRGIPGVALRTNFIVGFPGETDADFEELMSYVAEEPFDHLVVFAYEREPGTPSHEMTPRVPLNVRRHRRAQLLAHQQRLSRDRLSGWIGRTIPVMVDAPAGRGQWSARTAGQAFEVDGGVVVEGEGLEPGAVVPVRITGSAAYDLFARVEKRVDTGLHIVGGRS